MTNNEKKEWLQRYRECWAEVEITQQEIEELNSRAQKITASLSSHAGRRAAGRFYLDGRSHYRTEREAGPTSPACSVAAGRN